MQNVIEQNYCHRWCAYCRRHARRKVETRLTEPGDVEVWFLTECCEDHVAAALQEGREERASYRLDVPAGLA